MSTDVRDRLWELLDPTPETRGGELVNAFVTTLVALNVLAAVLQTVGPLYERYALLFDTFAQVSVVVLTVEYVLRVWASTASDEYQAPVTGRLRFMRRSYPLVDLFVILPFYVGALFNVQALSLVRLLWAVRLLRVSRFWRSRQRFKRVLRRQRDDLEIAFTAAGILVLFSSTLLYVVERGAQPDAFSSIPAALWWGIVTFTTVGYGDVIPVTPLGRFLAALTTLGGIAFFAVPSGILATGFIRDRDRSDTEEFGHATCPHCGRSFEVGGRSGS